MHLASTPATCRKPYYIVKCCELCAAHIADALSFIPSITISNLALQTVLNDSQKIMSTQKNILWLAQQISPCSAWNTYSNVSARANG